MLLLVMSMNWFEAVNSRKDPRLTPRWKAKLPLLWIDPEAATVMEGLMNDNAVSFSGSSVEPAKPKKSGVKIDVAEAMGSVSVPRKGRSGTWAPRVSLPLLP